MRASQYRPILAAAIVAALIVSSAGTVFGVPSTPSIEAAQAELESAQTELDRLSIDLSMQVEEYNTLSEELDHTKALISQTALDLETARERVRSAEVILSDRATTIYKNGPTAIIEVLLGTSSFDDLLIRLDYVRIINSQDAAVVQGVRSARREVENLLDSLETREVEQTALRDQARSKKLQIEDAIARQEAFAASLGDEVKRLIAEEEERQRQIAEERARQAAEAARLAAQGQVSGGSIDFPDPDPSNGPGRPEVVQIGLMYLGVPYLWGGSDPLTGFDCSGLTQYVYEQIGIDIPRNSRSQYVAGARIDESRLELLELGDLVFFGYDGDPTRVHHVGIYVGEGNFLHAPETGDVVKVSSLAARISSHDDYVGGTRF